MQELEQTLFGFLENPPGSVDELVSRITPDVYERLKEAVALGRWSEEERLSPQQSEQCMQLIILYEAHNVDTEARIGAPLSSECGGSSAEERKITVRGSSYGDGK
tara:strand:- start:692 stop:1006 length:315 start_codon:yes stop_codon:yes gene_type:complete